VDSTNNTADEPATQEPEVQTTYDKNEHEREEEHDEKGNSDLPISHDSADHIREASDPSGCEAQTTDKNDDELDEINEEHQEDEHDRAPQEDTAYASKYTDKLLSTPAGLPLTVEVGEIHAPVAVAYEYTRYDEYTVHDELGDGENGEIPLNEDNQHGVASYEQSETSHVSDSAGAESATSYLSELVPDHEQMKGWSCT
jgi:hypothetical protein